MMPSSDPVSRDEFEQLRAAVVALEERIAASPAERRSRAPESDDEVFWALEGLRGRVEDPRGALLFTGTVQLEPDRPYEWQLGATTASVVDGDWRELAPVLDALGHPIRLELLRLVATGTSRTSELAAADGIGTSGQVHHHLRQLVAAGWLQSAGRGAYEVPPTRVVPLLVVLLAARR